MSTRPLYLTLIVFLGSALTAAAFSPYENYRLSGEPQRIGLIAYIENGQVDAAKAQVGKISKSLLRHFGRSGVDNLNLFVREIGERSVVFAYFESAKPELGGLTSVLSGAKELKELEALLEPHSRAAEGEVWLRMEWMNCIATAKAFPHKKRTFKKWGS